MAPFAPHALIRGARLRPGAAPVDLRLREGGIAEIGEHLTTAGAEVHDAGGALAVPGLWDAHVHFGQWAAMSRRVDVADTASPEEVTARVARHLDVERPAPGTVVQGFGWRVAGWDRLPSTAELDAVAGDRPVVLISGDCHAGWLSSAAFHALGLRMLQVDHARAGERDERHAARLARLEAHRGARGDVQPHAACGVAVEVERAVGLGKVVVRADLDRPVAGVDGAQHGAAAAGVDLDLAVLWPLEQSAHMEQRRFAGAGRAHQHRGAARHRGERRPDHAVSVLVTHREDAQHELERDECMHTLLPLGER